MGGTKDRLLTAAAELFAERGFHRTTVRDIAARARVNVAAGNYHYGSKRALYLAVLRAQFADVRATLRARGDRPHLAEHWQDELVDDDRQRLARIAHLPVHQRSVQPGRRPDQQVEHDVHPRAQERGQLPAREPP